MEINLDKRLITRVFILAREKQTVIWGAKQSLVMKNEFLTRIRIDEKRSATQIKHKILKKFNSDFCVVDRVIFLIYRSDLEE